MIETEKTNPARLQETENKSMIYGEAEMKYTVSVIGEPGENGYPVYIALHGGGGTAKEFNDSQWNHMQIYYRDSVECGIYIATRGVRDTWNTHFNDESYPLYERLLANLSVYENIDTNRVYLMGYSAGGDGVYQISPRLADRFAAVNMSAGHPNGVNLTNLYNTPISLQCGENDISFSRHQETARSANRLAELAEKYKSADAPEGYIHTVFLHVGKGHGVRDNQAQRVPQAIIRNLDEWLQGAEPVAEETNTNAVDFVNRFTRNPLPERVIWDLSVRSPESASETFYWLRADESIREGVVIVNYDKASNTFRVEKNTAKGDVRIMLNDEMVDLFSHVTVVSDSGTTSCTVTPDIGYMKKTISEKWDKNMIFAAEIPLPKND
jgi:dienelactone hydrolase